MPHKFRENRCPLDLFHLRTLNKFIKPQKAFKPKALHSERPPNNELPWGGPRIRAKEILGVSVRSLKRA